jgi:hypothetical protein
VSKSKGTYPILRYKPGKYLNALKSSITEADLKSTAYRYRMRYEDLDLFLDVIAYAIINDNIGDTHLFGTVSAKYIQDASPRQKRTVC